MESNGMRQVNFPLELEIDSELDGCKERIRLHAI